MVRKLWIQINTPMLGHEAGKVIAIDAKPDGSPAELFWRRRLRDANRDQGGDRCVEIVSDPAASDTLRVVKAAPASGGKR